MVQTAVPVKTCTKCLKSKIFNEFYSHDSTADRRASHCKQCMDAHSTERRKSPEGRVYQKEYAKKYRQALRFRFHEMYGRVCSCCGDTRLQFLVLDHIKPLRRSKNRGQGPLREALKEYRPDLFQVLCHNCNALKGTSESCPCGTRIIEIMEK